MQGAIVQATLVTQDASRRVLKDAGILWQDGVIRFVGGSREVAARARELGLRVKAAPGGVVFPGLVNTHTHLFQQLLKGLGTDMSLEDWWPGVIGPTGIQMRERHLEAAVLGGALEALRCGTTTLADYMQVHPVPGLSEAEIRAASQAGIRLAYGRGFRDYAKGRFPRELIDDLDGVFGEILGLKREFADRIEEGMLRLRLAPAAIWAVSREGLEKTTAFAAQNDTPIMMHVFETDTDEEVCQARYGRRAIDCYEEAGLLRPDFLAVHAVKLDSRCMDAFAAYGVKVSHNPVSNMYLASGVAPVPELLGRGVTVSLATDGAASNNSNNMLEVMKVCALLHKVTCADPIAITARQVLDMATLGGAKALGLEGLIGSLEPGKRADRFLFEPELSPGCCPMHDPVATLVYSADTRGVTMTVVNGRILLENGAFVSLDEEMLLRREQEMARELYDLTDFGALARKG